MKMRARKRRAHQARLAAAIRYWSTYGVSWGRQSPTASWCDMIYYRTWQRRTG